MNAFTEIAVLFIVMLFANHCAHMLIDFRKKRKAWFAEMDAKRAAVNAEIDEILSKN